MDSYHFVYCLLQISLPTSDLPFNFEIYKVLDFEVLTLSISYLQFLGFTLPKKVFPIPSA